MAFAAGNKRIKATVEDAISDIRNFTPFNELKVAEKSQQLILNSNIPISNQRDITTTANGGTVTQQAAEYRLRATATTNSSATLQSEQRGRYIAGNVAEAGMGIRIPTMPTGDARIRWGYFKNGGNDTGFLFELNSTGFYAKILESGVEVHSREQANWRLSQFNEAVDGSSIDFTNGNVFQINFVYYGYGCVQWDISNFYFDSRYNIIPAHITTVENAITTTEPNLPITVDVDSGTSGQQLDVFVGGRQFSTYGKLTPIGRIIGEFRAEQTGIGLTFVPTVSFRYKDSYKNIFSTLRSLEFLASDDFIYSIQRNATLTGASFNTPTGYTASECATEWDKSATAMTGGQAISTGLIAGGNQNVLTSQNLPDRFIYEEDTITVGVRAVTGTNKTITSLLKIEESW